MDYLQISYYLNRPNATWDSRYLSFHHLSLTSLCPDFFRGTIIIEAQTKQVLWEVAADMIVIKILAAPFVVALTLIVAIISFLYCVASALCHIGYVVLTLLALVLFIGGQTLGGVVFLVLAFLVSPFGIPAIADWLMDRLYSLKYSLQDFITG